MSFLFLFGNKQYLRISRFQSKFLETKTVFEVVKRFCVHLRIFAIILFYIILILMSETGLITKIALTISCFTSLYDFFSIAWWTLSLIQLETSYVLEYKFVILFILLEKTLQLDNYFLLYKTYYLTLFCSLSLLFLLPNWLIV